MDRFEVLAGGAPDAAEIAAAVRRLVPKGVSERLHEDFSLTPVP